MMTLGERVKRRRRQLGLTQVQLAEAAGVPQSLIAALETEARKQVRSQALRRLARALRCSADDLIGTFEEIDEPVPPRTRRNPQLITTAGKAD